jgi:hypothetical protein
MTLVRVLLYALSTFLAFPAMPQNGSDDTRKEGEQLWQQMLVAKGGRDRLMEVRSIEQTQRQRIYAAKPWLKDTDTQLVRFFAFPDRMWQWFDGGSSVFGLSLNVYNLALGVHYLLYPNEAPRKLSSREPAAHDLWEAQLIYLNESTWLHPVPVRVIRDSEVPRGVDAIETKLDGDYYRADFYLEKHTHLPARIILYVLNHVYVRDHVFGPAQVTQVRYELSKYREMDGVLVPDRVIQAASARDSFLWNYDVRLNVPFREDAFTTPPSLEAGPYAWKLNAESQKGGSSLR